MVDTVVFDTARWKNGISRTLLSHLEVDKYDTRIMVAGGTGRKVFLDGMGNGYLSGNQAQLCLLVVNYDARLEGIFRLNSTISSIELRLRSRHLLSSLPQDERFGGYAVVISLTQAIFVREVYHDSYTTLATVSLTTSLVNDKQYPMVFSVIDDGSTVDLELKVDYGGGSGLESVATTTDSSPPSAATNKNLFLNDSHAWIRTNGTEPLDLFMRDVKLVIIPS